MEQEVIILDKILKIKKKDQLKGEDGHKTFSVRLKDEIVIKLDEMSVISNRSRNELINILLDYAINHAEIEN